MFLLTLLACGPLGGELKAGDDAVDLDLIDENGEPFYLSDDRGQVIFLDMSAFH